MFGNSQSVYVYVALHALSETAASRVDIGMEKSGNLTLVREKSGKLRSQENCGCLWCATTVEIVTK